MSKMLERMSELQTLYKDGTKSTTDVANYTTEFEKLGDELHQMQLASFNGNDLYSATSDLTITTSESGDTYQLNDPSSLITNSSLWTIDQGQGFSENTGSAPGSLTVAGLVNASGAGTVTINGVPITITAGQNLTQVAANITSSLAGVKATLGSDNKITITSKTLGASYTTTATAGAASTLGIPQTSRTRSASGGTDVVSQAIADISEARAQNGADQSVLTYRAELVSANKVNFESAVSKIMDVDVAEESTQLARWNTLVQAGTAMIAQANGSTQSALTLLR
jgi:flagellin-like hook-associated protein FlgL